MSRCASREGAGADPASPCSDLQSIPFTTRLLHHLRTLTSSSPYPVTFTISPAWFARIGTVGIAVSGSASASKPRRIGTREESKDGTAASWRPASIFGGIFGGAAQGKSTSAEVEHDGKAGSEEEEEEGTIKGLSLMSSVDTGGERKVSSSSSASTTARLSTLFTDWMAPDPASGSPSGTTKAEGASAKVRLVSEPVAIEESKELGGKCMSLTSVQRTTAMGDGIPEAPEEEDDEQDLDAALDTLMVRFFFERHISEGS